MDVILEIDWLSTLGLLRVIGKLSPYGSVGMIGKPLSGGTSLLSLRKPLLKVFDWIGSH